MWQGSTGSLLSSKPWKALKNPFPHEINKDWLRVKSFFKSSHVYIVIGFVNVSPSILKVPVVQTGSRQIPVMERTSGSVGLLARRIRDRGGASTAGQSSRHIRESANSGGGRSSQ